MLFLSVDVSIFLLIMLSGLVNTAFPIHIIMQFACHFLSGSGKNGEIVQKIYTLYMPAFQSTFNLNEQQIILKHV